MVMLSRIGYFLIKSGSIVIDNMPLFFVIGVSLGGKNNILNIDCCATRLRLDVKNTLNINEEKIKSAGALGYIKISDNSC